jgi:hypothetical protein
VSLLETTMFYLFTNSEYTQYQGINQVNSNSEHIPIQKRLVHYISNIKYQMKTRNLEKC